MESHEFSVFGKRIKTEEQQSNDKIIHSGFICFCLQSSDSHWLSPADRDQLVMELRATGWVEVEDRNAIFKELHFKNFNQVCVCVCIYVDVLLAC